MRAILVQIPNYNKKKKYKKVISGKISKNVFIGHIGNSCDSEKKII